MRETIYIQGYKHLLREKIAELRAEWVTTFPVFLIAAGELRQAHTVIATMAHPFSLNGFPTIAEASRYIINMSFVAHCEEGHSVAYSERHIYTVPSDTMTDEFRLSTRQLAETMTIATAADRLLTFNQKYGQIQVGLLSPLTRMPLMGPSGLMVIKETAQKVGISPMAMPTEYSTMDTAQEI